MPSMTALPPGPAQRRETVVLVHGLAAGRAMLRPLERSLQQRGYQTFNWGYPSVRGEIQALSDALTQELIKLNADASVFRLEVADLVDSFLRQGRFARQELRVTGDMP